MDFVFHRKLRRICEDNLVAVVTILVYACAVIWLYAGGMTLSTDYPFHLHSIWSVSKGEFVSEFVGGGYFVLRYGAPITLLGAFIYPLFAEHTVAVLLALAVPILWFSAEKFFSHFTGISRIVACVALLNPLTIFYILDARLPFVWGVAFALISLHFYLDERRSEALLTGVLAIVTHPMTLFLLFFLLLVDFSPKDWLRTYGVPAFAGLALGVAFFGLSPSFGIGWPARGVHIHSFVILALAFLTAFWLKEESRILSGFGLVSLAIWAVFGGAVISVVYFSRIGFLVFLPLLPALVEKINRHVSLQTLAFPVILALVTIPGGVYGAGNVYPDDPTAMDNIGKELAEVSNGGSVYYAADGSALYELPKDNIRVTNSGVEGYSDVPDNGAEYREIFDQENADFVLVLDSTPQENVISSMDLRLVCSVENVRVYAREK